MVHILVPRRYVMATVHVLYQLPDYPSILQNFFWQTEDMHPEFPRLNKFVSFWERELPEAPIVEVKIGLAGLVTKKEIRMLGPGRMILIN